MNTTASIIKPIKKNPMSSWYQTIIMTTWKKSVFVSHWALMPLQHRVSPLWASPQVTLLGFELGLQFLLRREEHTYPRHPQTAKWFRKSSNLTCWLGCHFGMFQGYVGNFWETTIYKTDLLWHIPNWMIYAPKKITDMTKNLAGWCATPDLIANLHFIWQRTWSFEGRSFASHNLHHPGIHIIY